MREPLDLLMAVVEAYRPYIFGMSFGTGLVLVEKLANAQEAIRRHGSQKRVAIEARIAEPMLARKLRPARATDPVLNLRDVDKLRFYLLRKQGKFARFELVEPVGQARWSGRLIDAWLNREHASQTKHFGAARHLRRA
jgi:hypothetical protein